MTMSRTASRAVRPAAGHNGGSVTAATYTAAALAALTEAQFQNIVVRAAHDLGWASYHTRYSLGSNPGFMDLVLVRPSRFLVAELKRVGGKTTAHQDRWLALCRLCPGIETYLWFPTDLDAIYEVLR